MYSRQSDYTYHVRHEGLRPVIVIEDLNLGHMSVTNNIEAVVAVVCKEKGLTTKEAAIIYRDSDGVYDGVYEHNGAIHIYALARLRRIKDENEAVIATLAGSPQW